MIKKTIAVLTGMDNAVFAVEKILIYTLLLVMAGLAFLSVVLQAFFNIYVIAFVDLTQNMVLWCTFLGGAIGARGNRHLNINAIQLIQSGRFRIVVEVVLFLAVAVIAAFLAYSGWRFVSMQHQFGEDLPSLGVNLWMLQVILPYTFAIVTFRYFLNALRRVAGTTAEAARDVAAH